MYLVVCVLTHITLQLLDQSLVTVQDARKEYNSLTDQIRVKYEQLDSGE